MSRPNNSLTVAEAKSKNLQAEEWMLQKKYTNALHLYCGAIQLCPSEAKYYVNRSRCHLLMNELQKAQNDAKKAMELDPTFLKGHIRLIECYMATGDLTYAESTLQRAKNICPDETRLIVMLNNIKNLKDNYKKYQMKFDEKKYEEALQCAETCIGITPNCVLYKFAKIQCLNSLRRFYEVEQIANEILKMKPSDENALYFKTAAQCYHKSVEEALPIIKKLRIQLSDHKQTNELFKNTTDMCNNITNLRIQIQKQNYTEAHVIIKKTIKIDENFLRTNQELRLVNIHEVAGKDVKNDDLLWNGALDCLEYNKLYGFHLDIFKKRIHFLMLAEEYEDAIEDLKELCTKEKTKLNQQQLKTAEKLFQEQKKCEYKILKVSSRASPTEIKVAAMKLKRRYHPDKNVNVSPERKRLLEERLIRVRDAEEKLLK